MVKMPMIYEIEWKMDLHERIASTEVDILMEKSILMKQS